MTTDAEEMLKASYRLQQLSKIPYACTKMDALGILAADLDMPHEAWGSFYFLVCFLLGRYRRGNRSWETCTADSTAPGNGNHAHWLHLQAINLLKKLPHSLSILGHLLHKVRLFLHGLQGTYGRCGQVGRQRCAVTVAEARQALVVNNIPVPSAEPSNRC